MRFLNIIFVFLLSPILIFAQSGDDPFVITWEKLEVGKTYEVFGNNIKLRESPSSEGEVLELLPLRSKIKLLEKTSQTIEWNGGKSHWWKVEHDGQQGYTVEGLIADASVKAIHSDSTTFVFKTDRSGSLKIHIKAYNQKKLTHAMKLMLIGSKFQLRVKATGFANIKDIIEIDYLADACGEEGGKTLLFWDGTKMYYVADLTSMADGGLFHTTEKLIFPFEEGNYYNETNAVVFLSEYGEMLDEALDHYKKTTETKKLVWQGDKFYPDVMRKQQGN